ncbi:MAG: hypothetical protein PVG84_11140 [Desulfobacterales bacterium]|jgi:hypothetical protein
MMKILMSGPFAFLVIIGRDEIFTELGVQVSGVRFQAGSHFFPTDTRNQTPDTNLSEQNSA